MFSSLPSYPHCLSFLKPGCPETKPFTPNEQDRYLCNSFEPYHAVNHPLESVLPPASFHRAPTGQEAALGLLMQLQTPGVLTPTPSQWPYLALVCDIDKNGR